MGYTAHELAKLSGVSVRTLHYYEEQGLLRPQRRPNGYRDYGPDDVRRLQQVLLYRRASMPLAAIRSVLDQPAAVQADALREQLDHLREQQRQLGDLIVSVERLIDETRADLDSSKPATPASQRSGAERNTAMDTSPSTDAARFEALKQQAIKENEAAYGAEARKRYGDTAVDTANRQVAAMTQDQWDTAQQQSERIGELIARPSQPPPTPRRPSVRSWAASSARRTGPGCSTTGRPPCTAPRRTAAWPRATLTTRASPPTTRPTPRAVRQSCAMRSTPG